MAEAGQCAGVQDPEQVVQVTQGRSASCDVEGTKGGEAKEGTCLGGWSWLEQGRDVQQARVDGTICEVVGGSAGVGGGSR